MAKLLLWAVVIIAALIVIRVLNFQKAVRRAAQQQHGSGAGSAGAGAAMVRCAHCHIYLPRDEAYMSRGQTYCCAEHARLGLKK